MRRPLFFLCAIILSAVIPAQTSMAKNKGEILYNEGNVTLYKFETKGKWGVSDPLGKIVIPAIYYDKPVVAGGVVQFPSGYRKFDFYTLNGKTITKNAHSIKQSRINPALYIVDSDKGTAVYKSGIPFIPYGKYSYIEEYPSVKRVLALTGDKHYFLGENYQLLSKPNVKYIKNILGDTLHFAVTFTSGKTQLCDKDLKKISEEYDEMEPFFVGVKNRYIKVRTHGSPPLCGVLGLSGKPLLDVEWDEISLYDSVILLKKRKNYFFADSLMQVDRSVTIDSVNALYQHGIIYRANGKWKFTRKGLRHLEFDDFRGSYHTELLSVKKYDHWGVYNLEKKKWAVPPRFDSLVHFDGYGSNYHTYTTKMGPYLYLIEQKKFTLKGEGYDEIVSLQSLSDIYSDTLKCPGYVVNRGGKMTGNNSIFTGGKSGLMNEQGDLIHVMNADVLIPLRYTDNRTESSMLKGLLWNCGGTSKPFASEIRDSVDIETFDENGNFFMKRVAQETVYDQKVIGGKFGIVNVNGKEIFPAIYDDMRFGFIYGEREYSIYASYRDSMRNRHDFSITQEPIYICKDGKWGVADWNGKFVMNPIYDSIKPGRLGETKYYCVYSRSAYGYADSSGKIVLPIEFSGEEEYYFSGGEDPYVLFQKGGSVSTYSLTGDTVEVEDYDPTGYPILVKRVTLRDQQNFVGGSYGLYNAKSKTWFLDPIYQDIVCTQEYESKPRKGSVTGKTDLWKDYVIEKLWPIELKKDGKWGLADKNGKAVSAFIFDSIGYMLNENLTQVWQNGAYGYHDSIGKLVVPTQFHAEEIWGVKDTEEEWCMLQKGGAVSIYTVIGSSVETFTYDQQGNEYSITYTSVPEQQQFTGGNFGFLDLKTNTWVIEPLYEDIKLTHSFSPPDSNELILRTSVTDKYRIYCSHVIDGKIPIEIKQNGKWGVFIYKKGVILKPEYDEIKIEGDVIIAKQAGTEKRFALDGTPK